MDINLTCPLLWVGLIFLKFFTIGHQTLSKIPRWPTIRIIHRKLFLFRFIITRCRTLIFHCRRTRMALSSNLIYLRKSIKISFGIVSILAKNGCKQSIVWSNSSPPRRPFRFWSEKKRVRYSPLKNRRGSPCDSPQNAPLYVICHIFKWRRLQER